MSRRQARPGRARRVNVGLLAAIIDAPDLPPDQRKRRQRQLVADFCKLFISKATGNELAAAKSIGAANDAAAPQPRLSPRLRQTLDALLAGDSEKQIALKLSLSQHTVHVYVKALYRGFGVSSRGELLSRFVSGASA